MPKDKGMKVTKGPGGKEVKLTGKTKHVQVLRSIILIILKEMVTETDLIDGTGIPYLYHDHLLKKLEAMGERDPISKINQLISHGYLVIRTKAPDSISYYVFGYKTKGQEFRRNQSKKA